MDGEKNNTERLFLGLHLDALFQTEIAVFAQQLRVLYPDQKWVNLRHFHFTIHFLGDTTAEQKQTAAELAREIAAATKPFLISLEGMGAFPSLTKPRVIWIGASKECRLALTGLYENVTKPFIAAGFPVEHETFTPHATLFRVRAETPIIWDKNVFQFPKTDLRQMHSLTLFKSVLQPHGSEYIPVETYPFGA